MFTGEIIRVALGAIWSHKLRSFLTMLGIVIGVAAMVTMVGLGRGAQLAVQEQIESLGTRNLSIYPGQHFRHGIASADRAHLTTEDATALARDAATLAHVVPEQYRSLQVKRGNQNINVNVVGTTAEYVTVQNYRLLVGRMFTHGDGEARKRVAVLGFAVPDLLGANGPAMVGQNVWISGISFEIIGVLEEKGSQGSWRNRDEQILVPIQTSEFRVFGSDLLRSITVQVASPELINIAMIEIERILRREHGVRPGMENDFRIRNRTEFLTTYEEATQTFTFLLAGIATISLLVGGIGIMNIMLVSVTERTAEIGIRKAVGATGGNILQQFLLEAVVLCLLGGGIGILAGAGGALALASIAGWNTVVSPVAVVIAVLFSAAVGILFGMLPARRAAGLDPIAALRHE